MVSWPLFPLRRPRSKSWLLWFADTLQVCKNSFHYGMFWSDIEVLPLNSDCEAFNIWVCKNLTLFPLRRPRSKPWLLWFADTIQVCKSSCQYEIFWSDIEVLPPNSDCEAFNKRVCGCCGSQILFRFAKIVC